MRTFCVSRDSPEFQKSPPSRLFAAARPHREHSSSSSQSMGSQQLTNSDSEWPATRVRETFISFYKEKLHTFFKSSPVVPQNDPTLLFAEAGMNQFEPIFMGTADPNTELSKLRCACNTQKCIRAGGKHNDLNYVGKDTYHHTFFEMLGSWSFGDYFKKDAIEWAWELLTKVYKLPEGRIYATYFGGDEKLGLHADVESRDNWLKYLPSSRVLPFGCKDNFWEMGDTGPCGPCSEIHYDRIGDRDAKSLVNKDNPTVIEIWNLVFIEYNRVADGSLKPRLVKHVDSGMGFERLTSILQNKMSNYDTDLFVPIFAAIQKVAGVRPYSGIVGPDDKNNIDTAYRVVADHIRTISFAIADGSSPGNEGREYVLRRILYRAVRYGRIILKSHKGFFNELVQVVVEVMGDVFPELKEHKLKITQIIHDQEMLFERTLGNGVRRFKMMAQEVKGTILSGQDAFDLWDTYGFPLDLTQLMAEERGLTVNVEGFNMAMDKTHNKHTRTRGTFGMDVHATFVLHEMGIAPTIDSFKFTWFQKHASVIKAIYNGNEFLESVRIGEEICIILETTSFFAEQGGQIFDTGTIESIDGGTIEVPADGLFEVNNVQIYDGFVLHIGSFIGETRRLKIGDKVYCKVDYHRRTQNACYHANTQMGVEHSKLVQFDERRNAM